GPRRYRCEIQVVDREERRENGENDRRRERGPVAVDGPLREDRDEEVERGERDQEQDVDYPVAEEPEQDLVEERIHGADAEVVEEVPGRGGQDRHVRDRDQDDRREDEQGERRYAPDLPPVALPPVEEVGEHPERPDHRRGGEGDPP